MEKFATNKAGNIDSGTEVLSNNMVFLQEAKAQSISNLFGDLFIDGILDSGQDEYNFALTDNNSSVTNKGTFNVSLGIAYKQDVNTGLHERIAITTLTEYSNISPEENDSQYPYGTGPSQKTDIGNGTTIPTPKSSGCLNIPIPTAGVLYYVDLRYLNVCDNGNNGNGLNLKNYSIAKNVSNISTETIKRFYQWIDGYEIVLIENLSQRQGIILGTVQKDINNNVTTTTNGKTDFALIKSKLFIEYFQKEGSGIVFKTIDGLLSLSINVDNITTEINEENQLKVTADVLYPYTKFTVNSGNKNSQNEPYILITDTYGVNLFFGVGNDIPLVVSPAYNDKYTILPSDTFDRIVNASQDIYNYYNETANGTYTICINNTDKDNGNSKLENPKLEIMKKVTISKTLPTIMQRGDIWVDVSVEPYKAKWYKNAVDGWQEYEGVPLGEADISNNTVEEVRDFKFASMIKNIIKVSETNFYNFNEDSVVNNVQTFLDDDGFIHFDNAKGIVFDTKGYFEIGNDSIDFNFSAINAKGQPIPRLPDYSTRTQVVTAGNGESSWQATTDGWISAELDALTGNFNTYLEIQNTRVFGTITTAINKKIYLGLFPIKKGETIAVHNGTVFFFSNR